jgi:hypothetical protein
LTASNLSITVGFAKCSPVLVMFDFVKSKDNQWQRDNHDSVDVVFILYCNAFSGIDISITKNRHRDLDYFSGM